MSKTYTYHIDLNERGYFTAHVENTVGRKVWYVDYPDWYCANCGNDDNHCKCEESDIQENTTIFEDGFMRHPEDVAGLEKYLKSLAILPANMSLEQAQ